MKQVLIAALIVALSGCTMYDVKRTPDGEVTVSVRSTRNFEQPRLSYDRVGDDAAFDFGAQSATSESMVDTYMMLMQSFMQLMTGVPTLSAAPSNAVSPRAPSADNQ